MYLYKMMVVSKSDKWIQLVLSGGKYRYRTELNDVSSLWNVGDYVEFFARHEKFEKNGMMIITLYPTKDEKIISYLIKCSINKKIEKIKEVYRHSGKWPSSIENDIVRELEEMEKMISNKDVIMGMTSKMMILKDSIINGTYIDPKREEFNKRNKKKDKYDNEDWGIDNDSFSW